MPANLTMSPTAPSNLKIIGITTAVGFVIMFADVIFDSVLEVLHIGFEIIEISFEELVQHIFHTEHHQSEIIGLYLMLGFVLIALIWLIYRTPGFLRKWQLKMSASWQKFKANTALYWSALPIVERVKFVSKTTVSAFSLLFIITL